MWSETVQNLNFVENKLSNILIIIKNRFQFTKYNWQNNVIVLQ